MSLKTLKSPVITGLCDLGDEPVDLHELTKFADLLLKIDAIANNYLAIKRLLKVLAFDVLVELLNECNKLDIKLIRFVIYDLFYVPAFDTDVSMLCDDLITEYNKVKAFYDKLLADTYIKSKRTVKLAYVNLYLACNNVTIGNNTYFVTYHFAKYFDICNDYDSAVKVFTECLEFKVKMHHNEDLDQNMQPYPALIEENGSKHWFIKGQHHNDSRVDGLLQPAVIKANGTIEWWINDKRHNDSRIDGLLQPAKVCRDGTKEWWINDKRHNDSRVDGILQPATINANGGKAWHINGYLHNDSRIDGVLQPATIWGDGSMYWYINHQNHNDSRVDGLLQPAIINAAGDKYWFVNDEYHNDSRIDGVLQPAVVKIDGTKEWLVHGERHNDSVVDGVLQPAIILANGIKKWYNNGEEQPRPTNYIE